MPTVELEIGIPKKELNPAAYMKEMTNCLFYAMTYNGYNIENSDTVDELKTSIKEAITAAEGRKQLLQPRASPNTPS